MNPCAGPISYNNAELLYVHTNSDGSGDDFDEANLRLTFSPFQNFYVVANVAWCESE